MSIDINKKRVDKALPLEYISRHFDEILEETGYMEGPSIDARKTKTIVVADADGTIYGKPTKISNPTLSESLARSALIRYMRAGGFIMINSSNALNLVIKRLLVDNAIPRELRHRVIVAADGGASLARITDDGRIIRFEGYQTNALREKAESTEIDIERTLDAVYIGDDISEISSDYPVFKRIGFAHSVVVSNNDLETIPAGLRFNYVGGLENGTGLFLHNVCNYADTHKYQKLFNSQGMHSIIEKTKGSLSALDMQTTGQIARYFGEQMDGRDSLAMMPSYITRSNGQEAGEFVAVDWGGSNLRVMLVRLIPGRAPEVIKAIKTSFTKQEQSGYNNPFKDIVCKIEELGLEKDKQYALGFTFSQPVEQRSARSAVLRQWTKGWHIPSLIGKDVGEQLQQALTVAGIGNVEVTAVLNDVVATHLAVPNADIGLIIGTGFTTSVIDENAQIINTEAGNFYYDGLPQTIHDKNLYQYGVPLNRQAMEKMISGAYLGKLLRMHLQELRASGKFMKNTKVVPFVDVPQKLRVEEFQDDTALHALVSAIYADANIKNKGTVSVHLPIEKAVECINEGQVLKLFSENDEVYLNDVEAELCSIVKRTFNVSSFSELSDEQAAVLSKTPEGQSLERTILNLLYADMMPAEGPDVVMTKLLCLVEQYGDLRELRAVLSQQKQFQILSRAADEDLRGLQDICETLSRRAGNLVAAIIFGSIKKIDPLLENDHVVAVDGSVYEKHPTLRRYVDESIAELRQSHSGDKVGRIRFVFAKDASGIGAAIAAARTNESGAYLPSTNYLTGVLGEELRMVRSIVSWLEIFAKHFVGISNPDEKEFVSIAEHIVLSNDLATIMSEYTDTPTIHHVWFTDLPEGMSEELSPVSIKITLEGIADHAHVWTSVKEGNLIFFIDLRTAGITRSKYDQVLRQGAAQIISCLGGADNLKGNNDMIHPSLKLSGKKLSESFMERQWEQSIIVDHLGDTEKTRRALSDSFVNSPLIIPSTDMDADKYNNNMVLQKRLIRHNALSQTMAENKLLEMDMADIREFIRILPVFNSVKNGQMLVDWKVLEVGIEQGAITEQKLVKLLKEAGNHGVQIHCISDDNKMSEARLRALGFASVIVRSEIRAVNLNSFDPANFKPDDLLDIIIPYGMSDEQIREAFTKLKLSNTMIFHSRDILKLIDTRGDMLEKQGIASMLKVLLNFGKAEILTTDNARRLGFNWLIADIPHLLPGENGQQQLKALCAGDASTIAHGSPLYDQVQEFSSSGLRVAFLTAIAEKMLIREWLLQENEEVGKAYEKGQFHFANRMLEEITGDVLLQQALMTPAELKRDRDALLRVTAEASETTTAVIMRLSDGIRANSAKPGSITAILNVILLDVLSDQNIRKHMNGKTDILDIKTVSSILSAA